MSYITELAGDYYAKKAEGIGIKRPDMLDGQQHSLMSEGDEEKWFPSVAPGPVGNRVVDNFAAALRSVVPLVIPGRKEPENDHFLTERSRKNIAVITGSMLLTPSMKSANLAKIYIEAIAPQEVESGGMLAAFGPVNQRSAYVADPAARPVFFVVSGLFRIKTGPAKPCAGLAAVYAYGRRDDYRYSTGRLPAAAAQYWFDLKEKERLPEL